MKGLIQKSGYIQPGSGGEQYVKYIATGMVWSELNLRQEAATWNIWQSVLVHMDCFPQMAPPT